MKPKSKKISVQTFTLKNIYEKIEHLHKDVEQNHKDIVELKEQVAMGKGGVKVIFWIGAIIGAIVTMIELGDRLR